MERYLAWIVYLFGVVSGDITVMLYYALVVGWDGLPAILGALFCSFVGVIPTLAGARGHSHTFRALNTVVAFALAAACVFAGITAFRLIRGQKFKDAAVARDVQRGKAVKDAVVEARAKGLRSRDAAKVAESVASVVKTEATATQAGREEVLVEPEWFPWFPWIAGFIAAILSVVLLIPYRKTEDRNKDGIPDFLQGTTIQPALAEPGK
jgi:hypothetical protein